MRVLRAGTCRSRKNLTHLIALSIFLIMAIVPYLNVLIMSEESASLNVSTPASQTQGPALRPLTVPSGVLYYRNVTVSNPQGKAISSSYDQLVVIDSKSMSRYESSDLQNVEWFTFFGEIIQSWIQSGDSRTSTDTVYWLKMPLELPSNSTVEIFIGFASTGTNLFKTDSGREGVAPELTSQYAQYDNGATVFPFYDNFAGTTLNTNTWQTLSSGSPNFSVDNGFRARIPVYTKFALVTQENYSYPLIFESDVVSWSIYTGIPEVWGPGETVNLDQPAGHGSWGFPNMYATVFNSNGNSQGDGIIVVNSSKVLSGIGGPLPFVSVTGGIIGMEWQYTGLECALLNDYYPSEFDDLTDSTNTIGNYYLVALFLGSGPSGSGQESIQWVRARSPLPDNVMPYYSLSSSVHSSSSVNLNDNYYLIIAAIGTSLIVVAIITVLMYIRHKRGTDNDKKQYDFESLLSSSAAEARHAELKSMAERGVISKEFHEKEIEKFKKK